MRIARGWEKRVIRTSITYAKRTVRIFSVSPQSRSLFSASFQTFCLTARAHLNAQKYGLFCSLHLFCSRGISVRRLRPMVCQNGSNFERLRKNSKKTQRCVRIAKFFRRRGSRSNAYFQIIITTTTTIIIIIIIIMIIMILIIINVRLWALKAVSMT